MLTIRAAQMASLQQPPEEAFVDRLVAHLRAHHADRIAGTPPDLLRRRVVQGVAQARTYGMTWESAMAGFVSLLFAVGPRFHEQPAIAAVLRDPSLAADLRLHRVMDRTAPSDWEDAARGAWESPD